MACEDDVRRVPQRAADVLCMSGVGRLHRTRDGQADRRTVVVNNPLEPTVHKKLQNMVCQMTYRKVSCTRLNGQRRENCRLNTVPGCISTYA